MAAYRRVYESHHLQADCQEPGSAPEPYTLGNRVYGLPFNVTQQSALCGCNVFFLTSFHDRPYIISPHGLHEAQPKVGL